MGSLFNNRKILHGLPKVGQKIVFRQPAKFAFFRATVDAEKNLLEIGKTYTVRDVQLNSSTTYVWLEEFTDPNVFFNMHSFDWEAPEIQPEELIGFYESDLAILRYKYSVGVIINDEVRYEGSPVYSLTVENGKIVKAEFNK